MKKQHHKHNPSVLKAFFQYGFHIWILLFVSNIAIFYTFSMFSFGQESEQPAPEPSSVSQLAKTSPAQFGPTKKPTPFKGPTPLPTVKPKGPVIGLSFVMPGIGSGGGTVNPKRTTRNLNIYVYARDVNSYDPNIKPLYTIRTSADYDTNDTSPTYTTFVNKHIDLGNNVKNGKYQIAFSTEQSIRKLVKEKDNSIGGQIFTLAKDTKVNISQQTALMGDITPPEGNNTIDIADYNVMVDCFKQAPPCDKIREVDMNEDGVVDGIDYNILAIGFRQVKELGMPVPSLVSTTPKPSTIETAPTKPAKKPAISPSVAPVAKQSGSGAGAFIFLMLLMGMMGGGLFVFARTKKGKEILKTLPLPPVIAKMLKLSAAESKDPAQTPPAEGEQAAGTETTDAAATDTTADPNAPAEAAQATDTSAAEIAESTEIPIESLKKEQSAATGTEAAPAAPADPNAIDKTYYVKNKSKDAKGTWVVLTDDAGPVDGLLPSGDIEDGFERIKGKMTEENGKKYVLISEVLPTES